jgi:hypothetical protein
VVAETTLVGDIITPVINVPVNDARSRAGRRIRSRRSRRVRSRRKISTTTTARGSLGFRGVSQVNMRSRRAENNLKVTSCILANSGLGVILGEQISIATISALTRASFVLALERCNRHAYVITV